MSLNDEETACSLCSFYFDRPMSLNDEETACSLCSFYFDLFIFRRASCRLIRTSPLLLPYILFLFDSLPHLSIL